MTNPAVFIGEPLRFKKICKIYPPKVREVLTVPGFGQYKHLLTLTQEDLNDELIDLKEKGQKIPSPFEFLLINCYHNKEILLTALSAFQFFLHEEVFIYINEKIIIVGKETDNLSDEEKLKKARIINEDNYFDFQNLIRISCGDTPIKPPEPEDPNEDPRVARIKRRARERDRIKAKRGAQNGGITLDTCLVSICCMGIGITPLNIGEMSYASLFALMSTYQNKEKYDMDVKALLAGADSKKIKPKYWIRNTD